MIFEEKKKYVAPKMDVIDMECRSILCGSSDSDPIPDELDIVEDQFYKQRAKLCLILLRGPLGGLFLFYLYAHGYGSEKDR